jgi:pSer/pThr/pTyr-binding forkhead associated (FHA) protein
MDTVQDFLEQLLAIGEDAFRNQYCHPFLLYGSKHGASGFSTYHTQMADRHGAGGNAGDEQELLQFRILLPSTKVANASTKLLVGRGPERDFSIDHSTVSKRHAYLLYDPEHFSYQLGDAGSTNGTFFNGQPVEAGEPVNLRDSCLVSFGDCDYLFFSPEGFVALLKRLMQSPPPSSLP